MIFIESSVIKFHQTRPAKSVANLISFINARLSILLSNGHIKISLSNTEKQPRILHSTIIRGFFTVCLFICLFVCFILFFLFFFFFLDIIFQ